MRTSILILTFHIFCLDVLGEGPNQNPKYDFLTFEPGSVVSALTQAPGRGEVRNNYILGGIRGNKAVVWWPHEDKKYYMALPAENLEAPVFLQKVFRMEGKDTLGVKVGDRTKYFPAQGSKFVGDHPLPEHIWVGRGSTVKFMNDEGKEVQGKIKDLVGRKAHVEWEGKTKFLDVGFLKADSSEELPLCHSPGYQRPIEKKDTGNFLSLGYFLRGFALTTLGNLSKYYRYYDHEEDSAIMEALEKDPHGPAIKAALEVEGSELSADIDKAVSRYLLLYLDGTITRHNESYDRPPMIRILLHNLKKKYKHLDKDKVSETALDRFVHHSAKGMYLRRAELAYDGKTGMDLFDLTAKERRLIREKVQSPMTKKDPEFAQLMGALMAALPVEFFGQVMSDSKVERLAAKALAFHNNELLESLKAIPPLREP